MKSISLQQCLPSGRSDGSGLSVTQKPNPHSGFIGMTVVFIAWRYMRAIGQRDCLNTIAVICGFISCIGICIVGKRSNLQMK